MFKKTKNKGYNKSSRNTNHYDLRKFTVCHNLFTEDHFDVLKEYHNTIINGERYEYILKKICEELGLTKEKAHKYLEKEVGDLCGFKVRIRKTYGERCVYLEYFSSKDSDYDVFYVVEDIKKRDPWSIHD